MSDKLDRERLTPERYELREAPPYRFAVSRREFLELTGAGLLIMVAAPSGAPRSTPQQGAGGEARWRHGST